MFNKKTPRKTKKAHKIYKIINNNMSWGFTHPCTSEFFSDFWIFFNLTKPLKRNIEKLIFHPFEVVSRYRDPQLQVSENC